MTCTEITQSIKEMFASKAILAELKSEDLLQLLKLKEKILNVLKTIEYQRHDITARIEVARKYNQLKVSVLSENKIVIQEDRKDRLYFFVNKEGEMIGNRYEQAFPFSEGFAAVEFIGGGWNYIYWEDGEWKKLNDEDYQFAHPFSGGYARVKDEKGYFLINHAGHEISIGRYDNIIGVDHDIAIVEKGGKSSLFYPQERRMGVKEFDKINPFYEGIAAVEKDGEHYFITKNGQELITSEIANPADQIFKRFEACSFFSEGLAAVKRERQWYYIDKSGRDILSLRFDKADPFSEGLAAVKKDGKKFYIDKTGKNAHPQKSVFEEVDLLLPFDDGIALICGTGMEEYYYINRRGKPISKDRYEFGGFFNDGLAMVKKGGETYYIDRWGNRVYP